MARTHGRVMAAIWSDGDFIAMRATAQRMFMFLLSQPDLSHAGLIPMRVNRWAKKAEDQTARTIRAELDYLAERDFVVVDEDTEEVLIRTFVRNDGVYKQPKVMIRLREDAKQIESPLLRYAFRQELDKLPLHELANSIRGAVEVVAEDLRSDFADVCPGQYPREWVSDTPGDGYPEGDAKPSGRVSDTPHVRAGAFHLPPTTVPHPPATIPPSAGEAPPSRGAALEVVDAELVLAGDEPTAQSLVGEWIDHCDERPPGRVVGQVAKELKTMLDEGVEPERLRRALAEWNRKGLHPSTLPSVVHEIANRLPQAKGQQATNDLFDAAMQRAIAQDRSA